MFSIETDKIVIKYEESIKHHGEGKNQDNLQLALKDACIYPTPQK